MFGLAKKLSMPVEDPTFRKILEALPSDTNWDIARQA